MKPAGLLAAAVILLTRSVAPAAAQAPAPPPDPAAPVYVVSYIDIKRSAKAEAMTLLKQFRAACAKEAGNRRCEAAQRMEQQNEFVMLEIWADRAAFKAHASGPGAHLRERLKPLLESPYDERIHTAYTVAPQQPAPEGRIVYAITHIDIVPVQPILDKALPLLAPAAEAGRKDRGNGRFEVLQQTERRSNHFTLVEIWSNRRTLEAHQMKAHTMRFREQLQPNIGALYDERLYKVLD
jgi:quinol monooxygenase YgiN